MIPIISKVISWFTKNSKLLAVTIIMILSAIFVILSKQLKDKDTEINRLQNNCLFYEQLAAGMANNNRTLLLTIDDLIESNDSIIKELNAARKELKIKDKELSQAQTQSQVMQYDTVVVVNDCDFSEVIKPNELTSITINKKDSILTTKLDIRNVQTLFITNRKEYIRKYKNWFVRLFRFDFKKRINSTYQIHNSNDLIKTDNVRIIEIK